MFCSTLTFILLTFVVSPCLSQTTFPVNVRVEGANNRTIFEGLVLTNGHNVSTASGGMHSCDGTNNTMGLAPGPTMTSALDNATFIAKPLFKWDGPFVNALRDYNITAIGGDVQQGGRTWDLLLDYQFIKTGGCQQRVAPFSNVLFALGARTTPVLLNITGPSIVPVGQAVNYTVRDGLTGAPVAGAVIPAFPEFNSTDKNGNITLRLKQGTTLLKAQKMNAIRSNGLNVTGIF